VNEPGQAVLIRTRALELGYTARKVLSDVNLEIHAGQVWFLIGPNGTGKTTLLRALLGMLAPRSGTLEIDSDLASRERIGFVPQKCVVNPSLPTTVREFVSLGLVGTPIRGARRRENLRWALERVGLGGLEHAAHGSLSGGQHQRALVARALVRRPSLLILDEPTEGLDPGSEEAFLRTLADLNREDGVTLLFVTHKLEIADRYATHVALFHDGRVVSGPRRDILRPEEIARVFGVATERIVRPGAGRGGSGAP
jgi:ABC-type Mn2+/Zn2+ transport system ATPase subunit